MNQSGQRWDKYRLLPSGDVWWWCWWREKLDYSEPVEGETQSQTAIRSKVGNRTKARPPEVYECDTFAQRRCIFCNLIPQVWLIQTEKNIVMCKKPQNKTKETNKKLFFLHNPRWGSASPCCSSHLFPVFEQQILIFLLVWFCLSEQLFESIDDVLMMITDRCPFWTDPVSEDCGECGVKCYDGGQIG